MRGLSSHAHRSYAPVRPDGHAKWYIDGFAYFHAVYEAMEKADTFIMVTDFQLSPDMVSRDNVLIRMPSKGSEQPLRRVEDEEQTRQSTFKALVKRKAAAGVKIFIVLVSFCKESVIGFVVTRLGNVKYRDTGGLVSGRNWRVSRMLNQSSL